MRQLNKDRLLTIVLLLGALVVAAWLPSDYSLEQFVLVGIIILSALVWLIGK